MFGFGTMELCVVLVIGLLLFGSRLPAAMGSLGEATRVFRRALRGIDDDTRSLDRVDCGSDVAPLQSRE